MTEPAPISPRERARRRHRRRTITAGVAGLVVLAGAGSAWALTRPSGPRYRLATVVRSDVHQTVDADGTVATINQATLSFATTGTVASVAVKTGSTVKAGQVVARLDRDQLEDAVLAARRDVATVKQRLAADETTQASSATTAAVTSGTTQPVQLAAAVVSAPKSSTDPLVDAVLHAQQALVAAQHGLDQAISDEDAAIDAATTACAETDDTTGVTVAAESDGSGTVHGTVGGAAVTATLLDAGGAIDTTTTSANPQAVAAGGTYSFAGLTPTTSYQVKIVRSGKAIDTADCTSALGTVETKRTSVDDQTSGVTNAMAALTTAVHALRSGAHSSAPSGGAPSGGSSSTLPAGTRPSGRAPSAPSGTQGGFTRPSSSPSSSPLAGTNRAGSNGTPSGGPVTAQQIVADQRSIDAAEAALAVARQNRGLAVLRTPITGTVADLSISKGQSVSSSTTAMAVLGSGRKAVTVDVGIAKIDLVKPGQSARITVDGHTAALAGRVTQVGLINTASSSGSSATYAVTVVLAKTATHLYDGMGATVSIDVGTAHDALAVPLSAVLSVGTLHTVRVYAEGTVTPTRVTLGVAGDDRVEVTAGLHAGQRVVLAQLNEPIPSTNSSGRGSAGFGGFGGAGGFIGSIPGSGKGGGR